MAHKPADCRLPVVICVDTSQSMAGGSMREVEAFLEDMRNGFREVPTLARRLSVCTITFNDEARVAQDWLSAR